MARKTQNIDEIEVKKGPPPASTRGGRALHPQVQKLIELCRAEPGEWFSLDAGSVTTAASRKATLNKHGIKATIRGQEVFARTMTEDEVAEYEAAQAEKAAAEAA